MHSIFVIVIVAVVACATSEGGLTLGKIPCGQTVCDYGDYCSEFDRSCRPCSKICDISTHNYDEALCVKDCQDYLHDVRYVQKDDNTSSFSNANLKATVQRLSHMVTVNLSLVCFMLVVLAALLCFQLYRWMTKKDITWTSIKEKLFAKKSDSTLQKSAAKKPELRLEMPCPSLQSDSPATLSTTISRHPAEDSTLDYAYDNPAMVNSSPNSKPSENTF